MPSLSLEVVSDFVCPWCFIGKRRLELALASRPEVTADWSYRPFLLDPATPEAGADLRERLLRKYGDPEPLFRRVENAAKENGIDLNFSKIRRSVSTVRAHTLSRHAIAKGTQRALVESLFAAYFLEGRDISAMDVLVELAEKAGFDKAECIALLESPKELQETREMASAAAEQGVTGVPFTVVGTPDSKERFAVSGAQAPEVFAKAIDRALG
jgi:predicted DsbA family dithiol-disulfide isomerase